MTTEAAKSVEEQNAASQRLLTVALKSGDGQTLLDVKSVMDARDAALAALVEIGRIADAWLHGEESAARIIVQIGGIAERAIVPGVAVEEPEPEPEPEPPRCHCGELAEDRVHFPGASGAHMFATR